MEQYEKVYVGMYLHVSAEGIMKPYAIEWDDGRVYHVEQIVFDGPVRPAYVKSDRPWCYKVIVQGREKKIYLEQSSGKWFLEKPIYR